MDSFASVVQQRLWPGSLMETLGFEVVSGDQDGVTVEVAMRPGLNQISGSNIFHGGVMMALADVAAALACVRALDPTGASGDIPFSPLVQLNANMFPEHGPRKAHRSRPTDEPGQAHDGR